MSGGLHRVSRWLKQYRVDQRGAIAAEFALITPLLLLFSFGIIEFGRAMWMRNAMQTVVEDASRCFALDRAELTTRNCDTTANVQAYAASKANQAGVTTLTASNFVASTQTCGKDVTATYDFQSIVPLIPLDITMTAKSCRAATPAP